VADPLLSVRDLVVRFATDEGALIAVRGVSFDVPAASTVALVGESGCGKTVTALAIMRLLSTPPAQVDSGQVIFEGRDLLELGAREMRAVRGARLSIVFQDPQAALNPFYSVGWQLVEAFRIHRAISRAEARKQAVELLRRVGFPEPQERFGDYPHELSGGMCQRVLIAIALACKPALLIADEPTTSLDTLAAAQVGSLLSELRRDLGMSLLLISHDMAQVAEVADRVVVLYAGRVLEQGGAAEVLARPRHPYTRALLRSIPPAQPRQRRRRPTESRLAAIGGSVPDLRHLPSGCPFRDRCAEAFEPCSSKLPALIEVPCQDGSVTLVRCLLFDPAEDPPWPTSLERDSALPSAPAAHAESPSGDAARDADCVEEPS